MVLSYDHGHCESSPGSFDECRLSAGWPPTLRPSQPTWAVSLPTNGCSTIHIHHRHLLLLLSPKTDTHFTIPRRVEGWVDLGTAGRVRSPCPRLHIALAVVINITSRSLTPQSIMPSLNHCDLLRHLGVNNLLKVVTRQRHFCRVHYCDRQTDWQTTVLGKVPICIALYNEQLTS